MSLAWTAAQRSEDPWGKVGAVALSADHRVLGTGYNGLMAGFTPPAGFWEDRDGRRQMVIHAETNLLALLRRGDAHTLASTLSPCSECARTIIAHGVKRVIFGETYWRDPQAREIFSFYGIKLIQVAVKPAVDQVVAMPALEPAAVGQANTPWFSDATAGYRFLDVGESILSTDEVSCSGSWNLVSIHKVGQLVGMQHPFLYRRKVR